MMLMSTSIVAQRYANAFFTCVKGQGRLEEVYDALEQLGAELSREPVLVEFFKHSWHFSHGQESLYWSAISRVRHLGSTLLQYLVDQGRAESLSEIITWFSKRYREELGIAEVELITAIALDEPALRRLLDVIENKLAKRVVAKTVVDPEIIGGLVIRHEGMVYDGSVRTMLQQVQ